MAITLSIFGVAFAAFCVWLTVRVLNRRERWAKWTAATVLTLLAYPLSFGPACWIGSRFGGVTGALPVVYWPLTALMDIDDSPADLRPRLTLGPRIYESATWGNTILPDGRNPFAPGALTRESTVRLNFRPHGILHWYAQLLAQAGWGWRFQADYKLQPDPIVRLTDGHWDWCR
jgi:hypothetical protein